MNQKKKEIEARKAAKRRAKAIRCGKVKVPATVHAQLDCGCCTAQLRFSTLERAREAFEKAGLQCSATIVDDDGVEHKNVDTFYGFELDKAKLDQPPLLRLAKRAGLL